MAQKTYGEWMRSNPKAPTDNYKTKSTEPVTNNHTLTAVEWLFQKMTEQGTNPYWDMRFIQAKQMEKEQMEQCYKEGIEDTKKVLKDELKDLLVFKNPYKK